MESYDSIDNKYLILKKKAKGGTALVYKVKELNKESQNIYAAKVLKSANNKNLLSENTLSSIYEKEIKILTELNKKNKNPYIINIIDKGEGEIIRQNKPISINKYLILDYASKGCLFDYIYYINVGLKEEYSKLLFYKILQGIKACHDLKICNRDIKLDNILLDKDYNPKICDFGFADFNSDELTDKVGTPSYMDPQVISKKFNNKYNGFKVDIFNLGIVLLILRTGKGDFTVNDAKLIFQKKEKKFWNSLESEGNKLDNDFKELVSKMLSYKQENRPKNIDEILNDKWFNSIKEIIKDKEKLSKL